MFGEKEKTIVYIASDHAGFEIKTVLAKFLTDGGYSVTDLGPFAVDPNDDYPDFAREVAEKISDVAGALGVLICGTGIGMAMAANRVRGVRAANCINEEQAEISRQHNLANVVTLGARLVDNEIAKKVVTKFLTTPVSEEERHVRRAEKLDQLAVKKGS